MEIDWKRSRRIGACPPLPGSQNKEISNMKDKLVRLAKITFLTSILAATVGLHASLSQTKVEKIDGLMKLYSEYGQFNGSVLVAEHGNEIYKRGFGLADMEWDIPNEPDTKFRLGSITKQFTSMIILQLVQEGKLKLDGKITDYLPDYPRNTGDKVTIHHLLTHTSGIPGYTEFPNFFRDLSRDPFTPQAFVRLFADSALRFEPGAKFSYSNSGYFLLGVIIEKITGKPYERVLKERILDPLNMKNTGYDHHETILKKRARGYEKRGDSYVNAEYLDMSLPYSAGSLYSTVQDLMLWDQALYTEKLLPRETRDLLFKQYIPGAGGWYGYGWVTGKAPIGNTKDSVSTIAHGGGINGFNTLIFRIPSEKDLIVLLNNTGGAPLNAISQAITGILYDKPYDLPRQSTANVVLATIMEHGIDAGLAQYHELREKQSGRYAVREGEMNNAGYQLLRGGKVQEAIEVFKLNVEEFPGSANVYDSLGEAYMVHGDKELAIKNYRKSLELNPANTNGTEMLKKLQDK